MTTPTRVFLGDLRYDHAGVLANDCMPLGIAYMKAVMDQETLASDVLSRMFVYPEKLLAALKDSPPDVLMLTNYVWNEALSREFFAIAKQINPNVLTVMGGPNIPIEPERQAAYVTRHPEIDVYALGEGDFLATTIVRAFQDAGLEHRRLGQTGIPSSVYRNDGEVIVNPTRPRHREVSEIPSAWLTGIQDEFFDGRLAPMIETNRGCPFTCTFCVQGTGFYTKVHNFSVERVKEEISYIAEKITQLAPKMGTLRIADSNYGMYERDIEISRHMGQMQRDYAWPTFIDATTGKNRPDRIIKSVEEVGGALVLYQAVQSLDEDVLRKIKRQTIKLDAYKQLEVHMRGRGLRSNSDLILGLPGESIATHLHALTTLLDSNIHQMHNFQAMVLKGSEMETIAVREMFGFDTRFRVLPRNFGIFDGRKVFDVEEIVVATDTLPFEDYVTCRKWHLVSSVFWNDGWFEGVVRFLRANGIRNSEWWSALLPAMEQGSPRMRAFLDSFVAETIGELFPDRESCVAFCAEPENFAKLERGEFGDNLMYRYRAIASFHLWDEVCTTAMAATKQLLEERGVADRISGFARFWDEFQTYIRLSHAAGHTIEDVLASTETSLHYDFRAWLAADEPGDPNEYHSPNPRRFLFALTEDGHRDMHDALTLWTLHVRGLSKLVTRLRIESQVRVCRPTQIFAAA
jgi:radical SAM superfamily enzyme YgiQ (UPF0313 family)